MSNNWLEGWSHSKGEWERIRANHSQGQGWDKVLQEFSYAVECPHFICFCSCSSVSPCLSVFSCACKKSAFKAVLSYSGIKNCHPTLSTRQSMAAHVLCEGKHQGCSGRGELCAWLGLLVPLAGCHVGLYLVPVHTQLYHLERWTVVARPCLENLQETTESPHGDPHFMKTWNLCSLAPNALASFPNLTRDAFLLQGSMSTQI